MDFMRDVIDTFRNLRDSISWKAISDSPSYRTRLLLAKKLTALGVEQEVSQRLALSATIEVGQESFEHPDFDEVVGMFAEVVVAGYACIPSLSADFPNLSPDAIITSILASTNLKLP